jgi:hypothetical protein
MRSLALSLSRMQVRCLSLVTFPQLASRDAAYLPSEKDERAVGQRALRGVWGSVSAMWGQLLEIVVLVLCCVAAKSCA